ncbi:hypothetical protein M8J76_012965 [Diaphorina citri]|nr:hypothetical protein M8J76_012965 [Diaphorina citri]
MQLAATRTYHMTTSTHNEACSNTTRDYILTWSDCKQEPTPRDAIDKLRPDENNGRRGLIVTNDSRAPCGDSMFHDIVIYVIGYCDNSARELLY